VGETPAVLRLVSCGWLKTSYCEVEEAIDIWLIGNFGSYPLQNLGRHMIWGRRKEHIQPQRAMLFDI
jgi:hypothetical protein